MAAQGSSVRFEEGVSRGSQQLLGFGGSFEGLGYFWGGPFRVWGIWGCLSGFRFGCRVWV